MPFSGLVLSKLKKKIRVIYVYIEESFEYGLWGGGATGPPSMPYLSGKLPMLLMVMELMNLQTCFHLLVKACSAAASCGAFLCFCQSCGSGFRFAGSGSSPPLQKKSDLNLNFKKNWSENFIHRKYPDEARSGSATLIFAPSLLFSTDSQVFVVDPRDST